MQGSGEWVAGMKPWKWLEFMVEVLFLIMIRKYRFRNAWHAILLEVNLHWNINFPTSKSASEKHRSTYSQKPCTSLKFKFLSGYCTKVIFGRWISIRRKINEPESLPFLLRILMEELLISQNKVIPRFFMCHCSAKTYKKVQNIINQMQTQRRPKKANANW